MSPELIDDVQRLVDVTELQTIEVYHLHASRLLDVVPDSDHEIDPRYTLNIDIRTDGDGFRVRLLTEISTPLGEIAVGNLADYALTEGRITRDSAAALAEFINGVALMHIIPYTRQMIADVTQRAFQSSLMMPMIQRGQIEFSLDEPETDKQQTR